MSKNPIKEIESERHDDLAGRLKNATESYKGN